MCYMTTTIIPHLPGNTACLEFYKPSTTNNMAINTMKVSDGPTPFFTQHHPTNKTSTHPETLILEIIFSSDNNNTSVGNTEDVDEEVDEDAGDGDVHDNDSSSEESDEEESDEDDEEYEEYEEDGSAHDNDSDEDDYEDENEDNDSDEDFGNGFDSDDDLIVDFGGNDDDELLVEFEDVSVEEDTPPPPPPKQCPIPFWFTHEEQDQIKMIFDSYTTTLNIEEQRRACIRAPAPFIGRIIRTPLKPENDAPAFVNNFKNTNNKQTNKINIPNKNSINNDDKVFKTLDKVEVYIRELYPLGTLLPLSRTVWLLTEWDSLEGIPTRSVELAKSTQKSMQKRALPNQTSTLYCAPIFRTKDAYQYSVSPSSTSLPRFSASASSSPSCFSSSPSSSSSCSSSTSSSSSSSSFSTSPPPLMYASASSTNVSISRISPFLPEHCRVITFSLD